MRKPELFTVRSSADSNKPTIAPAQPMTTLRLMYGLLRTSSGFFLMARGIQDRHERFTLRAFFIASRFHSPSHVPFTINGLGTALSLWVKTRSSRFAFALHKQ